MVWQKKKMILPGMFNWNVQLTGYNLNKYDEKGEISHTLKDHFSNS